MKTLADLTAPCEISHKILEKDVQAKCVNWARSRQYWARKFSSQSQRSVPDYLFRGRGIDWFTEFKAPGKTSTDAQKDEQNLMRAAGWRGFECDNFELFKTTVLAMEKGEWR